MGDKKVPCFEHLDIHWPRLVMSAGLASSLPASAHSSHEDISFDRDGAVMGNAESSNPAKKGGRTKEVISLCSDSPERVARTMPSSPAIGLNQELILRSLSKRGLCIGESDLKDVLSKHSNHVEALAHMVAAGLARRRVKGKHPSEDSSQTTTASALPHRHENTASPPPPEDIDSAAAASDAMPNADMPSRAIHKRPRQEDCTSSNGQPSEQVQMEVAENDRPCKRMSDGGGGAGGTATMEHSSSNGAISSGTDPQSQEHPSHTPSPKEVDSGMDQAGPSDLPGEAVPMPDNSQSQEEPSQSPAAPLVAPPPPRDFPAAPMQLKLGMIERTLEAGLQNWDGKTMIQKEAAARAVQNDLDVPDLGPERQRVLDRDLYRSIFFAMEQLAGSNSFGQGHMTVSSLIRDVRVFIHDVSANISGTYTELYRRPGLVHGPVNGDDGSGVMLEAVKAEAVETPPSARNLSPKNSPPSQQSTMDIDLSQPRSSSFRSSSRSSLSLTNNNSRSSSGRRTWHQNPPRAAGPVHGSGYQGATSHGTSPASSNTSSRSPYRASSPQMQQQRQVTRSSNTVSTRAVRRTPPDEDVVDVEAMEDGARAHVAEEEEAFLLASAVCKAALKQAAFARKEAEWLESQAKSLRNKTAHVKGACAKTITSQEATLETVEKDLKAASDAVESITREIISAHNDPAATKGDCVRSLLATLQEGVSQEGLEAVNNRQNALNIKTSLQMAQTSTKEVLMLSRRGRAIADLLVEHLLGDLKDIIEAVQRRALEERISRQNKLKSIVGDTLEKFKDVIKFLLKRHERAMAIIAEEKVKVNESHKLFGGGPTHIDRRAQAVLLEMRVYAEDSVKKLAETKAHAMKLCARLESDLSEEDFRNLNASAKEFYASELAPKNADFGRENGEFLGGSPDSMGARMDSSDDCSIM